MKSGKLIKQESSDPYSTFSFSHNSEKYLSKVIKMGHKKLSEVFDDNNHSLTVSDSVSSIYEPIYNFKIVSPCGKVKVELIKDLRERKDWSLQNVLLVDPQSCNR